jgi:hypothetical protein
MSILNKILSGARFAGKTLEKLEVGKPGKPPQLLIYNGKIYVYNSDGQALIDAGLISANAFLVNSITADKLSFSSKKFIHNITWTAVDMNTASWSAGTIKFSDGTLADIFAGTTGNITEKQYIYFDGSSTLKKTKYYNSAVGGNHVILAIVQPTTDPDGKCILSTFFSTGTTIDGDLITTGKVQSINGKTFFDLNNNFFKIHDGIKTRLVIGKLAEGSYGIKLSLFSYDALTDTDINHFALWAASDDANDNVLIKEKTRGSVSVGASSSQNIAHGLSYIPLCLVFVESAAGVYTKAFGQGISLADQYYEIDGTYLRLYNDGGSAKIFKYYIFYDRMTT